MDIFLRYLGVIVVGGLLCVIAQILIDKTKLTSARILVIYVVAGVVLSAIGVRRCRLQALDMLCLKELLRPQRSWASEEFSPAGWGMWLPVLLWQLCSASLLPWYQNRRQKNLNFIK